MNKILLIFRREFWVTVKRKGYILTTLGIPLLLLVLSMVILIPHWLSLRETMDEKKVALIDRAQVVKVELASEISQDFEGGEKGVLSLFEGGGSFEDFLGKIQLVPYENKKEALRDLEREKVRLVAIVPEDYLKTGQVEVYHRRRRVIANTGGAQLFLRRLLIKSLLHEKTSPPLINRVQKPLSVVKYNLDKEGHPQHYDFLEEVNKIGLPYFFATLLIFSIVTTSAYLLQGLSEEKENRVMEVLLSSVSAQELFAGKLMGLGMAGLLQLAVWLSMGFLPALLFFTFLEVSFLVGFTVILYFLLGIALVGSLTLGFGAMGTRLQESNQFAMVWSMLCLLPLFFFTFIIDAPNGWLARLFSYFPLTSPITMVMRAATGELVWYDIPLTLIILVTSIWLVLKFSARLFRIGILLYGKRPTLKEIWRYLRSG